MRLEKEHIGKMVKLPSQSRASRLIAIDGELAWIEIDGLWGREGGWEVVEPKEKPSERIEEIREQILNNHLCSGFCQMCVNQGYEAIKLYLDEMAQDIANSRKDA